MQAESSRSIYVEVIDASSGRCGGIMKKVEFGLNSLDLTTGDLGWYSGHA